MTSVKHLYKFTELNADASSKEVKRMNKNNAIYCKKIYKSDVTPDLSATPSLCPLIWLDF